MIKAKCKHLPTITSYVSPLPTKSKTLWGPRNKEYSRTLSQHNKNEEHSKEHSSFLVRFVQTYSVFKQIAKSICNEYSICFSSQKLPYGGASVFVYGVLAYFHNIIKTRNILKNIPRFWYAGRDSNPRPTGS